MKQALLAILAFVGLALSGCTSPLLEPSESQDPSPKPTTGGGPGATASKAPSSTAQPPTPASGTMTVQQKQQESSGRRDTTGKCTASVVVVGYPTNGYCAERTYWIWGDMELSRIPLNLAAFNGEIVVSPSTEGWNLTVVLRADQAPSVDVAKARLNNLVFEFDHEEDGDHFVSARADQKQGTDTQNTGASMRLLIPAGAPITGMIATSNDDIGVDGFACETLAVMTSNGAITLDFSEHACPALTAATSNDDITIVGEVGDATLATSNSKIVADLVPSRTATWAFHTSNDVIELIVPEGPDLGYALEAATSNGQVTIGLQDGEVEGDTDTFKKFRTDDYDSRDVRVQVSISTSNDDVDVSPR